MLCAKSLKCEYLVNPMGIDKLRPKFSWLVESDTVNIKQTSYRIQISFNDSSFENPVWDSGVTDSEDSIHVRYGGPALLSRTRYFFRVKITDNKKNESPWSNISFFETGILEQSEWKAEFISAGAAEAADSSAATIFRKTFHLSKEVLSARIYATSLGIYELTLNGERIGDLQLTPGWTSYKKRLQYQTYDITSMLLPGKNALGAMVGNGWFKGRLGFEPQQHLYGIKTALFAQLHITYTDGSEDIVVSDDSWKIHSSPVLLSEIYDGETYDARLEIPGWDHMDFDDSGWANASLAEWDKKVLIAQESVPVKKISEIKPQALFTTPKGEIVLDMGQNMVGRVRFKVSGPSGSKVVLKHAEILDNEGNFYAANLRTALQAVEYILKGDKEEYFEPHFTFQGFRYVMLEQYPGKPEPDNFTGIVIHSEMEPSGYFSCSDPMINQLQHNILWGLKGNFLDVPTDCPQRDERLGWTGDAQVFSRTACFNMNTAPFFKKWLKDLAADQLENGGVPFVVPDILGGNSHSSSGWGDAAVICPWNIYLCYGDTEILEEQYDSMKGWVDYIRANAQNGLIWNSGFHFGDWLALDAPEGSCVGATSTDLIATAFYALSTELFAKSARVLAEFTGSERYKADAEQYGELHKNIVKAFRDEFITPAGRISVSTQTGHILPLAFGLTDEKDTARIANSLVRHLESAGWHLSTGFLGTPYLCQVLSSNGYTDIAYKLLMQTDCPSWLYPITKGATTIWEHWDGIKPDGSLWEPGMNSFNHYAYGAIGEWLYRVAAGIDTDEKAPGYKNILFRPVPGGGLTHCTASINSMYGMAGINWQLEDNIMKIQVEIPSNSTAELTLPSARLEDSLLKSSLPQDFKAVENTGGVVVKLGSGKYSFRYLFKSTENQ